MLQQQLFLLNANLNNAILRTRDECVQVWDLQLVGVQLGKLYSLQDLQASYKAAAKVHGNLLHPCACINISTGVHCSSQAETARHVHKVSIKVSLYSSMCKTVWLVIQPAGQ